MNKLILRSILLWLVFIPIAIINGTVRNFVYKPIVGDLIAHQVSTVIAISLFILVGYLFLKNISIKHTDNELVFAGLFLVFLTILFEFGFGHYVMGNSWEKLATDYNIFMGRTWALLLFAELVTPLVSKKLAERSIMRER